MEIINELLGYPRIKIIQDTEVFHFTIDSMLLASFATVNLKVKYILDICSGNGPVPLYLSLRTNHPIVGLEIQDKPFDLAKRSVALNGLSNQINMIQGDVKELSKLLPNEAFDLVTCNPPYFLYHEESHVNQNEMFTIARHEKLCTLDDICKNVSKVLRFGGYFSMVHRPERLIEMIETLKKYGLMVKRVQFVYANRQSEANHVLIEARKTTQVMGLKVLPPIFVYDENGKWTEKITQIYNYGKNIEI